MAKKELLPIKPEAGNNKGKLIKMLIIAGTFLAIAVLSIVTQGQGGGWPAASVIAIRIALLSLCTVIYFLMLYYTQASRAKDTERERIAKQCGRESARS